MAGHPLTADIPPEQAQAVLHLMQTLSTAAGRFFEAAGYSVADAAPLITRALAGSLVTTIRATARVRGHDPQAQIDAAIKMIADAHHATDAHLARQAGAMN